MRNILFLNNYDMLAMKKKVLAKEMPSHHLWGMLEIEQLGFEVDIMPVNVKLLKRLTPYTYQFILTFRLLISKKGYDIVFAACKHLTDILALFKICGLYKKKLIMIAHHPQSIWFVGGYDKIIFFSEDIFEKVKTKHPKHAQKFEFILWGPDVDFYDYWMLQNSKEQESSEVFISNGCTFRDLECFADAVKKSHCKAIMVSDKPVNTIVAEKVAVNPELSLIITGKRYHEQQTATINNKSVPELLEYYFKAAYVVIPLQADIVNLAGLTGIWDAFCLRKPLIISDNSSTAIPFLEQHLALVYKAGSSDDLAEKINEILFNPQAAFIMAAEARKFAEKNNIQTFAQKLASVFTYWA